MWTQYFQEIEFTDNFTVGGQDKGSAVTVGSGVGLHAIYAAAKAAVIGMSKTVAKEWGVYGVRCNTIAFGFIETRYVLGPIAVINFFISMNVSF